MLEEGREGEGETIEKDVRTKREWSEEGEYLADQGSPVYMLRGRESAVVPTSLLPPSLLQDSLTLTVVFWLRSALG